MNLASHLETSVLTFQFMAITRADKNHQKLGYGARKNDVLYIQ